MWAWPLVPFSCPSCTGKRHQGLKTVGCPTAPFCKMHILATLYFGGLHPISSLFGCAQLVTCTAALGSMPLSGGHFLFPASALPLWCRGRAGNQGEAQGKHLGRQAGMQRPLSKLNLHMNTGAAMKILIMLSQGTQQLWRLGRLSSRQ